MSERKWGGWRQIEFDKRMKRGKEADSPWAKKRSRAEAVDGGVGSTIRLRVFRSKAHRSIPSMLPPSRAIVTRTKAQSPAKTNFVTLPWSFYGSRTANGISRLWNGIGRQGGEITDQRFLRFFQTPPPDPPSPRSYNSRALTGTAANFYSFWHVPAGGWIVNHFSNINNQRPWI